jgi:tetratricopeptide (TPR) repeat protein
VADPRRPKGAAGNRKGTGGSKRLIARSAAAPSHSAGDPPQPVAASPAAASPATSLYERYKEALRRGHVAALRGRLDLAIDAYGEAATIARDRALPHTAIGGILIRMGRPSDALASFDRALELAPRDEAGLRGRAGVLAEMGRRVDAAETFDLLAEVLLASDRLPDASDAARRALELAESRDRRRTIEAMAARLRGSAGDEAAERALAQVLRLLEPAVEPLPADVPGAEPDQGWPAAGVEPGVTELEIEPEVEPEPVPDGLAIGAAAEDALADGRNDEALEGLLAAARAYRRSGRIVAAIDACYLALPIAPADVDLHLLLAELYLERGWRVPAVDKLLLLGRLAGLAGDDEVRRRLCDLAADRLPGEPRLAELCA